MANRSYLVVRHRHSVTAKWQGRGHRRYVAVVVNLRLRRGCRLTWGLEEGSMEGASSWCVALPSADQLAGAGWMYCQCVGGLPPPCSSALDIAPF